MKKNKSSFFVILVLVFSIVAVPAFAWQNEKKSAQAKGKLERKFFCQVKSLLGHKDIIKLNDQQVDQIKKICLDTKKELIRNDAEIEIAALDIKSSLFDTDKIDVKAVEKLIDEKYKFKKDKAKILVRAFAKVQGMLTAEQKEMVKDLKSEARQKYSMGMKHGKNKSMKSGMKCSPNASMGMCPKMSAPEAMSK